MEQEGERMTLEEAVKFIYKELDEAYCYNCRGGSEYDECEDRCEYCHRKEQSWAISKGEAEYIAKKILEVKE